ncbi:sensor histidine kinase [Ammoniphilus sp. CFH 90114]|uniref:sensor histidine kinase n=1 Tax=Ammoniphilus sp. CFH 90114 TaxID=2493665 RepID=UPI0013E972A1|nr:histidine kinase [Ammoniphilus sp. CFH 90114]
MHIAKRKTELEMLLKEMQLSHLASQIQPHFLFNSLNTVSSLIRIGKYEEATEAIHGISDLLRHTIREEQDLISIEEELSYVGLYLNIQELRFGKRLSWRYELDERIRCFKIPVFMIQALVENACKYGIEPQLGGGEVAISAYLNNHTLYIDIANTGTRIQEEWILQFERWKQEGIEADRMGIGLKNTHQRLKHYFAERAELLIQPWSEGTRVRVMITEVREG